MERSVIRDQRLSTLRGALRISRRFVFEVEDAAGVLVDLCPAEYQNTSGLA
jgi:hypothetical protein